MRNWLGFNEVACRIVVAEPEGGYATLALILAELKRLEGQVGHLGYKVERFRCRNEVFGIPESIGTWRVFRKQTELVGQWILPRLWIYDLLMEPQRKVKGQGDPAHHNQPNKNGAYAIARRISASGKAVAMKIVSMLRGCMVTKPNNRSSVPIPASVAALLGPT